MTAKVDIARFLRVLHQPGDVLEVRAPRCMDRKGSSFTSTLSGYYTHDHIDQAAESISIMDAHGMAPGFYVTLNPVNPGLLARAANRVQHKAKGTTQDEDIQRRRWLLVDVDPCRPSDVSSTDAELAVAKKRANDVRLFLLGEGWTDPVVCLSGNGYHLLYRIDEPANDDGLCQRVLAKLSEKFSDSAVSIDTTTYNPSRITKIIGTTARKGDHLQGIEGIEDRPHRASAMLMVPDSISVVSTSSLIAIAGEDAARPRRVIDDTGWFDSPESVRSWLESHGVEIKGTKADGNKTVFHLNRCIVNPSIESTGTSDISVFVDVSGKLGYCNQHNRGRHYQWSDVRKALDPMASAPVMDVSGLTVNGQSFSVVRAVERDPIEADAGDFPKHLLDVPGLIGDVVRYNLATCFKRQPVLALAGAIALQAALAGRKVRTPCGSSTSMFFISLAPSGGGKEHARQVNRKILSQAMCPETEGPEELASDSALLSALEVQPNALFQIDEFGRFLGNAAMGTNPPPHLAGIVGCMLKMFSVPADGQFRGKGYADSSKTKVIHSPCMVLHATSVPDNFYGSLTNDSMADGFVARLMVFESREVPRSEPIRDAIHPPQGIVDTASWWKEFGHQTGNVAALYPSPKVVPVSSQARKVFESLNDEVYEIITSGSDGAEIWNRAGQKAMKLALIHACSASASEPIINEESAVWAKELSVHSTRHLLAEAGRWIARNQYHRHKLEILRTIDRNKGEMARSAFTRRFSHLETRVREEILGALIEEGQIGIENRAAGSGRPGTVYVRTKPGK